MAEDLLTAEWLVTHLESDTGAGGIFDPARVIKPSGAYLDVIPQGKALPAIRFHVQSPHDVRGASNASARIMVRIDWMILVVWEGLSVSKMISLIQALDARLHNKNGETARIEVMQCIRLSPFSMPEVGDSGVHYRHSGGMYRTIVKAK